jgi:hypothetical protein
MSGNAPNADCHRSRLDILVLKPTLRRTSALVKNPSIRIDAGGAQHEVKVVAVSDAAQVKSVVEKFRGKYGTSGVNLYSKLDVAVVAHIR